MHLNFPEYTRFEVEGRNHSKIIKKLQAQSVRCFSVESREKLLKFAVYQRNTEKVVAILTELDYNYTRVNTGVGARLRVLARRIGLAVGLIPSVALLLLLRGFVFKVETNLPARREQIIAVLSQNGVECGKYLPNLEYDTLAEPLARLDGISMATVVRNGNTLYVQLKQSLAEPQYDYLGNQTQLIASKNATITRILVFDGTACVKSGDKIVEGDLLIDGYVLVGDQRIDSAANGEVFGKVEYSAEIEYAEDAQLDEHLRVLSMERAQTLVPEGAVVLSRYWNSHSENGTKYIRATIETEEKLCRRQT